MRYILLIFIFILVADADKVKQKTLACPSVFLLQKAPIDNASNFLDLSMYSIANGCIILGKKDNIESIGYDPRNSKEIYQKIIYKKTGVYLYLLRSTIQIEQDGKKSSYRF
ncbi:MAG: hypothetical protein U9N33_11855 [Campylobacterota bacterium]|nr:hypothetical protein [Campylobacterota bacterium]